MSYVQIHVINIFDLEYVKTQDNWELLQTLQSLNFRCWRIKNDKRNEWR